VTRDVDRDPAEARIVAQYAGLADATAKAVVGSVTGDLLSKDNPAGESSLGDVIADAQLAAVSAPASGGALVAFMNSGGIRADITGTGSAGRQVTYRELFTTQPFGNVLNVFTMTGAMIKRLLEQQFDNPAPGQRSILQVSTGFTYRYRANAPPGQHVDAESITLNGRRIDPGDLVRVEASDFLVGGGGGFSVLREGTDKIVGVADVDALVEYFKSRSPIGPGPQNRIVRID
jgi:5'-nucleotidase